MCIILLGAPPGVSEELDYQEKKDQGAGKNRQPYPFRENEEFGSQIHYDQEDQGSCHYSVTFFMKHM